MLVANRITTVSASPMVRFGASGTVFVTTFELGRQTGGLCSASYSRASSSIIASTSGIWNEGFQKSSQFGGPKRSPYCSSVAAVRIYIGTPNFCHSGHFRLLRLGKKNSCRVVDFNPTCSPPWMVDVEVGDAILVGICKYLFDKPATGSEKFG